MTQPTRDLSPRLVLGTTDHETLGRLARAGLDRMPDLAETLLDELDRARVVEDAKLPEDVVRMGARVVYRTNGGAEQDVTLVYPAEADIAAGKISVMTPIGTALIGLKAGQSITWRDRADKRQMLTVVEVKAAAEA
ncbi:nucleoside diphosphate kinase regulator [Devosia sp. FJ2-5-3]|jgi:regulator of nucleoside diphosphate kinase|uniref:nucleoside diphosphate kinase regulator n=1 Tax=Devosia sp. FJ2-5-3 TaxID=2976680 RepID=UPI0023D897AF|nr:nucleoside diphosphate kinase regulator [Devosia sp. FJ2-5-3]WEJ57691.1 nucleoside diphosphate kinase regulator [Devosia sp. FJ2-5-3]